MTYVRLRPYIPLVAGNIRGKRFIRKGRQRRPAVMTLPGLKQERELRCWSITDLALVSGLTRQTVALADAGHAVLVGTARKILLALEASPPSDTARRCLTPTSPEARDAG